MTNNDMIAYLNGILTHTSPSMVHMEVNGVGYEVQISLNTFSRLEGRQQVRLLIHQQFREDGQTLYGFHDQAEKEMFLQLIGITGVGASTARMMLSSMRPEEIAQAITKGDSRLLERVKGIGKKTAERIVLELKDKMSKQPITSTGPFGIPVPSQEQDALQALIALGIPRATGEAAIRKAIAALPPDQPLESLIKKALQSI
jgi:Holliday junction DNA helicase RuvA